MLLDLRRSKRRRRRKGLILIEEPRPAIASLVPDSVVMFRGPFALTVHGTGFKSTSVVLVEGAARSTRYFSDTRLVAQIPRMDVARAGFRTIHVLTPGVGVSNAATLTVTMDKRRARANEQLLMALGEL